MKEAERIELTISSSYLEHWTIYDALRELFQNSFDRAKEDSYAEWFHEKKRVSKKRINLSIGNRSTSLSKRTLILGETTKAGDKNAIGKFGEGYKLAILVLLRNKIGVHIRTGKERWVFKIEYSESFETKILVMYRYYVEEETEDLSFILHDMPMKMFDSYTQYNLKLQKDLNKTETKKGELLLDERNRGKIFVGDLYICKYDGDALYGYNFSPSTFQLGRDRNIIAGVDADWQAGQVLVEASIDNTKVLAHVSENINEKNETKYVQHFILNSKELATKIWNKFKKENPEGLPVSSQESYKAMDSKYVRSNPIIVSEQMETILRRSDEYSQEKTALEEREPDPTPHDILKEFYDGTLGDVSDYVREEFLKILEESEKWIVE